MPRFYRRPPWRQYPRKRRWYRSGFTTRRWRFRKAFRPRFRIHRRRRWVRKRLKRNYKKKLKYIYLKQYQPKKIRRCKVKGMICLFQCGPHRINREWTAFMNSFYPEYYEGGGGWSQIKFSLESLYEQRQLLRNYWTASNVLLPLVRYTGCKFKFYRTNDVDYICHYSICLPMLDTVYQHTNAQPNNMLMYPKHIFVPSLKTNPRGRKYVKKKIRPPEQFQNEWYFQVDLYKTPLVLLTTTACDFNRWYLNPRSYSNNVTLATLNTNLFTNHNFIQTGMGTTWWSPKEGYYLYSTLSGDDDPTIGQLIFLGQTQRFTTGTPIGQTQWQTYSDRQGQLENFGNIFHDRYINDEFQVFISPTPPNTVFQNTTDRSKKLSDVNKATSQGGKDWNIALLTQPIYETLRYNPDRDTGQGNKIYLVKTSDREYGWPEPQDEDLIYTGYPLWCLFWGWLDWQEKYKKVNKVEENYIVVTKTTFTFPQYQPIVLLDKPFLSGHSTWLNESRTADDAEHWHPKAKFQTLAIEYICESGPGTVKTSTNSIEAHMNYCFYFKWGGCPNDLENIIDPGEQKHYPVPHTKLQGPEIQDPTTDPRNEIWPFDVRHQTLTKRGAKRIKTDFTSETSLFTATSLQSEPKPTETIQKIPQWETETTSEEETETQEQQLQHLQRTKRKLQLRIKRLIKQTPNIKY
nr:MAG: ORF1 [TTV-like mini virus]